MTTKRAAMWGATAICLLGGVVLLTARRPVDDESLAAMLVGTWQATDPANSALHKRKEPVQQETVVVRPGGTLLYTVVANEASGPQAERWAWRVQKGRLVLQYRGDDGEDAGLLAVRVNAGKHRLVLSRKGYPEKEFVRVDR